MLTLLFATDKNLATMLELFASFHINLRKENDPEYPNLRNRMYDQGVNRVITSQASPLVHIQHLQPAP